MAPSLLNKQSSQPLEVTVRATTATSVHVEKPHLTPTGQRGQSPRAPEHGAEHGEEVFTR